jgi:hypothetical protein
VPVTDEEERDILLSRTPGGIESLEEKDRARLQNLRDAQLDRATDLLKGILLFSDRSPEKVSRPNGKMAAAKEMAK